MHRTFLTALAAAVFVIVPVRSSAQTVNLAPELAMAVDPEAARMTVAAMLGQLGETIIGAAHDTSASAWRIIFPVVEGSKWREYEDIVLRTVRGRRATHADSVMTVLSLSELQMHGDTLVANFFIGILYYCGEERRGSGTGYVMKSTRHPLIDGWSRPETKHALDSDSIPCERD